MVANQSNGMLSLWVSMRKTACVTAGQTHPFIHSTKGALAEWGGSAST